jgi:hypothetical protein
MKDLTLLVGLATLATGLQAGAASAETFTPHTESQYVDCSQVDKALSQLPHGNGDGTATEAETGPGGWRFSGSGRSFVTFAQY